MTLEAYPFPIQVGGNLCLDFTNTIEFRDSEQCLEFLHSYTAVLAWCWRNHLTDASKAERLHRLAVERPGEADGAFQAAVDLREALHSIFQAVIASNSPAEPDLKRLNQILMRVQPQRQHRSQRRRIRVGVGSVG